MLLCCLALATPAGAAQGVDAIDGALTGGDSLIPSQGNGGYDVVHYDIDLEFFPASDPRMGTVVSGCALNPDFGAGAIRATTTITATAATPLRSFGLDFKGLTITSLTVDGAAADYSRIQDAAGDTYKVVVSPAAPVTGTFTVEVAYEGRPELYEFEAGFDLPQGWMAAQTFCDRRSQGHLADGGAVGIGQPAGGFTWFPNNTTPRDKATYTTTLTAPSDYTAVGIGRLTAKTDAGGGRTTWTWDETMPATTFLAVAAIGHYTETTGTVELDRGAVPVQGFGYAAMEEAVSLGGRSTTQLVAEVVPWLEDQFGAYQPSVAGYIMAPLNSGWALEIIGKPVFTWALDEGTFVHEMAHQWAGNSVSVEDWSDLWLAEGYATYAEWLWDEAQGGTSAVDQGEWYLFYYGADRPQWDYAVAAPASRDELWSWGSYEGGGIALAALRAGVGDAVFEDITRTWFERYRNSNASTEDYIDLAEEVSGRELDQWAEDFLYSTDKPPAWPTPETYPDAPDTPDDPLGGLREVLQLIFERLRALITRLIALFTPA
jgi:aminopeptidase N